MNHDDLNVVTRLAGIKRTVVEDPQQDEFERRNAIAQLKKLTTPNPNAGANHTYVDPKTGAIMYSGNAGDNWTPSPMPASTFTDPKYATASVGLELRNLLKQAGLQVTADAKGNARVDPSAFSSLLNIAPPASSGTTGSTSGNGAGLSHDAAYETPPQRVIVRDPGTEGIRFSPNGRPGLRDVTRLTTYNGQIVAVDRYGAILGMWNGNQWLSGGTLPNQLRDANVNVTTNSVAAPAITVSGGQVRPNTETGTTTYPVATGNTTVPGNRPGTPFTVEPIGGGSAGGGSAGGGVGYEYVRPSGGGSSAGTPGGGSAGEVPYDQLPWNWKPPTSGGGTGTAPAGAGSRRVPVGTTDQTMFDRVKYLMNKRR
jgi:hypothetical protein